MIAADTLARAIARAIFEATSLPCDGALPARRDLFSANGWNPAPP
jgi:hypothetical protein